MKVFARKNIAVFFVVLVIGFILSMLGTISFPIESNMSYFWPGATIQAICGIFFGLPGVIAGTIFPSISNYLTIGSVSHVIWLIPANFLQSFIPLLCKRIVGFKPYAFDKKTIFWFVIGCAIVPNVVGAFLGCFSLYLVGSITSGIVFWGTLKVWIVGNIPSTVVFGLLLLWALGPVLKDCNLYYDSYL